MSEFVCRLCGSHEYRTEDGVRVCNFCGTREESSLPSEGTTIDLHADVARLLQKCKDDPARAKQYAQRILEIDPSNGEALKILSEKLSKSSEKSGCYVATAVYGSYDCPEVWTLRRYRDDTLAASWYGRAFIRCYYAVSPTLVKVFGKTDWFRKLWKPRLDSMVARLNAEGVENTPYQDRAW